jgi:uncharacterized protein
VKLGPEVFLDAAYLIALANAGDEFHSNALEISLELNACRIRIVTTHAILLEVGSALARTKFRSAAIRLVESLQKTVLVETLPLTEDLFTAGWAIFRDRPDKEWSWVDCISFVVMKSRGIQQALTTDTHFEQAGFVALLRD